MHFVTKLVMVSFGAGMILLILALQVVAYAPADTVIEAPIAPPVLKCSADVYCGEEK